MTTSQEQLARADAAFEAIMAKRLYSVTRKLFGPRRHWARRRYEALWPFTSAWAATCALASAPERQGVVDLLAPFLHGLAAYHRDHGAAVAGSGPVGFESMVVPHLGPGGERYYDDNAWLALALLRHHELVHDDVSLALAVRLFAFVVSGWSDEGSWSHPGGIRWKVPTSNVSRNTCSNAPVAELGVLVHRHTGDPGALEWAVRIYHWVREALLGDDGLYLDRIAPDGRRAPQVWTYNQGTMIGAGVLLFHETGEAEYLSHAQASASAALSRFDVGALVDPNGPAFNAVFFRNVLLLDALSPTPACRSLAEAYGEVMWREHRDPRTGLFGPTASPWKGSSPNRSPLNHTAPMVELYALLAGAAPHP